MMFAFKSVFDTEDSGSISVDGAATDSKAAEAQEEQAPLQGFHSYSVQSWNDQNYRRKAKQMQWQTQQTAV